jgi:CubicO group peptidase (beta-lactamase class C family)
MVSGLLRSRLFIASLGFCCLTVNTAVSASDADSVVRAIELCVETDMAAIDAPGAAVTVIHQGDVIFNAGFGFKRRGESQLVNAGTRFRIGSVTKMLTAAAVMQQVDAGAVDLNDPVTTWIPELTLSGQWPVDSITVRHLLTHTAALPDHYEDPLGPTGGRALADWAATLGAYRLHAPPDTFWNYSNPGFSLAGLVAERSVGLPYRELMASLVFPPAGMSATTFDPAEVIASGNYSWGHHPAPDGHTTIYAPDDYESRIGDPAGQAFSTAEDLATWALTLMDGGGSVLSLSSAEAMQARQVYLDLTPDLHYGLGVFAEEYKGLDVRQHGGNVYGWGAYLLWVPDERFVVSILGNTTYYLRAAAYCIVDEVLEPDSSDPPDYSTDPATWIVYTGSYEFMDDEGDDFQADVELVDDRLFVVFPNPVNPASPTRKELTQLYLDTFSMEAFVDGERDFELTFINRNTIGMQKMWLRNQWFVGLRVPPPRRTPGRLTP